MVPGLDHRSFSSFDGTEIAYQTRGDGPVIVLANGLGGTYEAFRHIYSALGERYRILCWDYRGLYKSATPQDLGKLEVTDQCKDLECLLDHEGVDRAVFVGWSMGVQVNFEFFRKRRERMAGIVAINGTYGNPFNTVMSSRVVRYVIPMMLRAVRSQAELVGKATRTVIAWDGLVATMKRFGMVSKTLDVQAFRDVAEGFKEMDWNTYTTLLERLGEHNARDVLPEINVPTLIVTGDKDITTPPFTAEKIHRAVSDSRLVIVKGGTHYTPVEYPTIVCEELMDFLAKIPGYGAENSPSAARG